MLICAGGFTVASLAGFGLWTSIEKSAPKRLSRTMIITDILAIVVGLPLLLIPLGPLPLFRFSWL
jgi:hypothetical protein